MDCAFCVLTSAGQHEPHCPYNIAQMIQPQTNTQGAWVCPQCGYVWAMWVSGCCNCNRPPILTSGTGDLVFVKTGGAVEMAFPRHVPSLYADGKQS